MAGVCGTYCPYALHQVEVEAGLETNKRNMQALGYVTALHNNENAKDTLGCVVQCNLPI